MTVKIKIGRILPKNWAAQQFRKAGGFFTFQSNMWEMWRSALSQFKKEADKDLRTGDDTLNVIIHYDREDYQGKTIQWQICECMSLEKGREDLVVERFKSINYRIEDTYDDMKKSGKLDTDKSDSLKNGIFNRLKYSKYKLDEVIRKGLNREGGSSVSDKMLELDILIDIEKEKEELTI